VEGYNCEWGKDQELHWWRVCRVICKEMVGGQGSSVSFLEKVEEEAYHLVYSDFGQYRTGNHGEGVQRGCRCCFSGLQDLVPDLYPQTAAGHVPVSQLLSRLRRSLLPPSTQPHSPFYLLLTSNRRRYRCLRHLSVNGTELMIGCNI
jgi:hypothetical protein